MSQNWLTASDGVRLAVDVWEAGVQADASVLLVHGYPDDRTLWDQLAPKLAERYRVVTFDVRGAGASDRPRRTGRFGLRQLADDIAAVQDAFCAGLPTHLVGHDWGAIQGWEVATDPRFSGSSPPSRP